MDGAVHAQVLAFLALPAARLAAQRPGADQGERPPLELVAVVVGELAGRGQVFWLADHGVIGAGVDVEGVFQAVFLQGDRQVGDVDADPAPPELLGGGDGGAAAAEGIQHPVAGVGGGLHDALEQGEGFLGGVAEALSGLGVDRKNICPNIAYQPSRHFI